MELVNDFTVNRPIDETWATLTDVPKITPCLPGASLEGVQEEGVFHGVVKLKVGPILANFKGEAHFVEKDDARHRAVLNAAGRDTGNKGNAAAVITAQLEAVNATTTRCTVSTDLKITGKFAQFGRGAMQDISNKLLAEFVRNLETLTSQAAEPDPSATEAVMSNGAASNGATSAASTANSAPTTPAADNVLDVGKYAREALLKRLVPVAVGVLLLVLVLRRRRRRRRH